VPWPLPRVRQGYRVQYLRLPRLWRELAIARGDGRYAKLLAALAKLDLLVLDDFGLAPLTDDHRRDFLELLEDRHGTRATLVTSQPPLKGKRDEAAYASARQELQDLKKKPSPRTRTLC
jgi:DNA replication protein DnaC